MKYLFLIITIFFQLSTSAQLSLHWGQVTYSDLEMTESAIDPNADALVLASIGLYDLDPISRNATYSYHKQIKILTKKGADDYGNLYIFYYHKSGVEKVKNIRAHTINQDRQSHLVSEENIYYEKLSDQYTRITIAFPEVAKGSILEYQYSLESSDTRILNTWYFQEEIPVRTSVLKFKKPDYYDFDEIKIGDFEQKQGYYVAKNVPAIKKESYVPCTRDYATSITLKLKGYDKAGEFQSFTYSWETIASRLRGRHEFGQLYLRKQPTNFIWTEIKDSVMVLEDDIDKIKYIYDHINTNIEWNNFYSFFSPFGIKQVYKEKSGNSAEINFLIIGLLRQAGIKSYPVLVNLRRNGRLRADDFRINQFDHAIAITFVDDVPYFIDAGNAYRPSGIVREPCLNAIGWMVHDDKDASKWVNIIPAKSSQTYVYNLVLSETGDVKGTLNSICSGYEAIEQRVKYIDVKPEKDWMERISKFSPKASINNYNSPGSRNEKLKEQMELDLTEMALSIGDKMYCQIFPIQTRRKSILF